MLDKFIFVLNMQSSKIKIIMSLLLLLLLLLPIHNVPGQASWAVYQYLVHKIWP